MLVNALRISATAAFSLRFSTNICRTFTWQPKANIISHIKRDRPPDVEGARDATALQYNIYNFIVF